MYEATFHVRGGVAYADATADRDVTVELWCNDHRDLLVVRGEDARRVREDVAAVVGVQDAIDDGDEQVLVTRDCLRPYTDDAIETYLERHDCLTLPPLRYADGGKLVRVLTLDAGNLTALYRDLGDAFDVDVRSKREVSSVGGNRPGGVDHLAALSERQREAVRSAWANGYYAIPRETSTAALAAEMGVERRTFEEHLRLAERRLLGALVDGGDG